MSRVQKFAMVVTGTLMSAGLAASLLGVVALARLVF